MGSFGAPSTQAPSWAGGDRISRLFWAQYAKGNTKHLKAVSGDPQAVTSRPATELEQIVLCARGIPFYGVPSPDLSDPKKVAEEVAAAQKRAAVCRRPRGHTAGGDLLTYLRPKELTERLPWSALYCKLRDLWLGGAWGVERPPSSTKASPRCATAIWDGGGHYLTVCRNETGAVELIRGYKDTDPKKSPTAGRMWVEQGERARQKAKTTDAACITAPADITSSTSPGWAYRTAAAEQIARGFTTPPLTTHIRSVEATRQVRRLRRELARMGTALRQTRKQARRDMQEDIKGVERKLRAAERAATLAVAEANRVASEVNLYLKRAEAAAGGEPIPEAWQAPSYPVRVAAAEAESWRLMKARAAGVLRLQIAAAQAELEQLEGKVGGKKAPKAKRPKAAPAPEPSKAAVPKLVAPEPVEEISAEEAAMYASAMPDAPPEQVYYTPQHELDDAE